MPASLVPGLTALALLVVSSASYAEAPRWREIGPGAGPLALLGVAPLDSRTLFAAFPGTVDGTRDLSRSTDGGRTWRPLDLPPVLSFYETLFALSPLEAPVAYVSGFFQEPSTTGSPRVFRTSDGGETWSRTGDTFERALLVSPWDPNVVYGLDYSSRVTRTTDAGASWRTLPFGDAYALAFDSGRPGRLCATVAEEEGSAFVFSFFCADDPAGSWGRFSRLPSHAFPSTLAADPARPSGFEIATNTGVARSSDGGVTWTVPAGEEAPTFEAISLEPRTATALTFSTDGTALLRKPQGSLAWERRPIPASVVCGPRDVLGFLIAGDGATLYLVTSLGRFVSSDLGDSWQKLEADSKSPGMLVLGGTSPSTLMLSTSRGLYRSSDAGVTWGPPIGGICFGRRFSTSGGVTYGTDFHQVHRSTDGGASWASTGGPTFEVMQDLAANPSNPSELYAATVLFVQPFPSRDGLAAQSHLNETALWHSLDGGATYARVPFAPDADKRPVGKILFDPGDPRVVWIAGRSLHRLDRDGWREIPLPLDLHGAPGTPLSTLAVDSSTGMLSIVASTGRIWATTDDGVTWTDIDPWRGTQPPFHPSVTALLADPAHPGRLYVSSKRVDSFDYRDGNIYPVHAPGGVFRSTDSGSTWRAFGEGLGDVSVTGLHLEPRIAALYAERPDAAVMSLLFPSRLDRVSPASGPTSGGTLALLSGEGFRSDSRVTIGGASTASVELLDAGRTLRVRTPAHDAGPADVVVENPDGTTASLAGAFRYEEWGSCRPNDVTLCLEAGRFAIRAAGSDRPANAKRLTSKSGWFWLHWDQDPVAAVKVLDGRSIDGHFWVSVSTLGDEALTIGVTDMVSGRSRELRSAPGTPLAVVDRETFLSD